MSFSIISKCKNYSFTTCVVRWAYNIVIGNRDKKQKHLIDVWQGSDLGAPPLNTKNERLIVSLG